MGILDLLGIGSARRDFLSAGGLGIVSPWSDGGNLKQVVWSDILGPESAALLPLSRAEAMTIPAVAKARSVLISTICRFPLRALDDTGLITPQPRFLYRTDSAVNAYDRMSSTIDDLMFYGISIWFVTRGSDDAILTADYVPYDSWKIDNGKLLIDDSQVSLDQVILFNPPHEGLLNIANRTLKGARDMENSWTSKVRNPIPLTVIKSTGQDSLNQDEIYDLLAQWATARRSEDGALGYLPAELELETHGQVDPQLFVEGRNASRSDIGSFVNIRASMLDGTASIDSLTYTTKDGEKNLFYEIDIPYWTDPIQARLSEDDVVPEGQRVRFDKYEAFTASPNPTDAPEKD